MWIYHTRGTMLDMIQHSSSTPYCSTYFQLMLVLFNRNTRWFPTQSNLRKYDMYTKSKHAVRSVTIDSLLQLLFSWRLKLDTESYFVMFVTSPLIVSIRLSELVQYLVVIFYSQVDNKKRPKSSFYISLWNQCYQVRGTCVSWIVVRKRNTLLKLLKIMYFSYMFPIQRSQYNEFGTRYAGVQGDIRFYFF